MSFTKVELTIDHDWQSTIDMAKKLLSIKSNSTSVTDFGNSKHYDLKSLGVISDHSLSPSWYRFSGPLINKTMPWLGKMLLMFKELNPDDGCISYMLGHGGDHIDIPEARTALNYIFYNSDSSAYTWSIDDRENKNSYPSDINTAWLLDTQQLHGVANTGERWTLSIHFNCEYEKVSAWFNKHNNLIFGKE